MEHPTFSLILETVNLELADLDEVSECLRSIAAQDLDIREACEVLLIESGDIPRLHLEQLCERFPWLTIVSVHHATGYEAAKQAGVERVSGDVVIFFDADCTYTAGWLRGLVKGMCDNPDIGVLGGETMIRPDGVYGLAVAATFSFDFYSNRTGVYPGVSFHWNNVAFRREILEKHPIPTRLPLFRTIPKLYADRLIEDGINIARQARSRALHAPPNGLSHFFWRYLMFGHDAAVLSRLRPPREQAAAPESAATAPRLTALELARHRLAELFRRLRILLGRDSSRWLQLPGALLIAFTGFGLMGGGYLATLVAPCLLPRMVPASVANRTGLKNSGHCRSAGQGSGTA